MCFEDLIESVIIDSSVETSLESEYLLNNEGQLEVIKKYQNGGSAKVYIKAKHPHNGKCSDLLLKKNPELKKMIKEEDIDCDNLSVNSLMRKAYGISKYSDDLQLKDCEIDVSKEDAKKFGKN